MPSRVMSCGRRRAMLWPSKRISPALIGASPEIAIKVEVFPAPFEPMIAVISP